MEWVCSVWNVPFPYSSYTFFSTHKKRNKKFKQVQFLFWSDYEMVLIQKGKRKGHLRAGGWRPHARTIATSPRKCYDDCTKCERNGCSPSPWLHCSVACIAGQQLMSLQTLPQFAERERDGPGFFGFAESTRGSKDPTKWPNLSFSLSHHDAATSIILHHRNLQMKTSLVGSLLCRLRSDAERHGRLCNCECLHLGTKEIIQQGVVCLVGC